MSFKSKAQIAKFQELVVQGKMSKEFFEQKLKDTPAPHLLPDRIGTGATTPGKEKPIAPTSLTWYPKIHTRIGRPKRK